VLWNRYTIGVERVAVDMGRIRLEGVEATGGDPRRGRRLPPGHHLPGGYPADAIITESACAVCDTDLEPRDRASFWGSKSSRIGESWVRACRHELYCWACAEAERSMAFAAHLQDDKSCLSFTRFMELRPPGGRKGRKVEKFTLEEAEATAARDGLVLVPSTRIKNPSRYKGRVTLLENGRYVANGWEEGTQKHIGTYATV